MTNNETFVQTQMMFSTVEQAKAAKEAQNEQTKKAQYAYGLDSLCGKPVHRVGEGSILTELGFVAIAISRNSSPRAKQMAERAAASIGVSTAANLVMGGTRDEDMPAIRACIKRGGKVLIVLPFGIGKHEWTDEVKQYVIRGKLAIVSQFMKSRAWTEEQAQLRNELIARVAWTLFIPECRGMKGVWDLAACFNQAEKTIRIPHIDGDSRIEHDSLIRRFAAVELRVEPKEIADEDVDIYEDLLHS